MSDSQTKEISEMAPSRELDQRNKEMCTLKMWTTSNQEKPQVLLLILKNKVNFLDNSGKLKTCPEINHTYRFHWGVQSNREVKCTKWGKKKYFLVQKEKRKTFTFTMNNIWIKISNATPLQKRQKLILGSNNGSTIPETWVKSHLVADGLLHQKKKKKWFWKNMTIYLLIHHACAWKPDNNNHFSL